MEGCRPNHRSLFPGAVLEAADAPKTVFVRPVLEWFGASEVEGNQLLQHRNPIRAVSLSGQFHYQVRTESSDIHANQKRSGANRDTAGVMVKS